MDQRVLRKVKRRDRIARWFITIGGMAIIFSVIFILLLIGKVTLPLFQEPSSEIFSKFALEQGDVDSGLLAVGIDEYLETPFVFTADGQVAFYDSTAGQRLEAISLAAPGAADAKPVAARNAGGMSYALLWSDGFMSLETVKFTSRFDQQGRRSFERQVERQAAFDPPDGQFPVQSIARAAGEESRIRVDLLPENLLKVTQVAVETDLFGNEESEDYSFELTDAGASPITALTLDSNGSALYAGTEDGRLLRWDLSEPGSPELLDDLQAFEDGRAITALAMVLGDISLAVGDAEGDVTTWFPVRGENGGSEKHLTGIHKLGTHNSPVVALLPSLRDKSVLSLDQNGTLFLDHMTSERHLLTLENLLPINAMAISSRGNGILGLDSDQRLVAWTVDNPHPEVSFKTLFGKVWYESYDEPSFSWQSSSASDDFEPKLSLTPLIFGTIKGTFYAMLFAVPLALLGAIYTSQFGNDGLRKWIKPTVEIMAAIPSVVIGFLAALWFAPLLERSLGSFFLSLILVPGTFVVAILLWQWLRRYKSLQKVERGYEFLVFVPILVLAIAAAFILGPLFEQLFFAGDFKMWLFSEMGTRYDPRNNIVIAFALGFAVIPIIFTISEDSLSNVPPSLKAASLALGASRWQTVWRVILPSASPGIFAGVMIGFGRAIGETMIVLMATGNTPIMDWSIFNGMRPLSSNIAVEIPEAPHGGTLYRVLFLSAVILFVGTFTLNTVAEVVRQRLRKKYGRF